MSKDGAAPVRSPAYPSMSLSDAIGAVRKIEAQYRSAPVDREVGAKILGYTGLSGPANKSLAALAHYGLVERAGKGHMRVTDRARAILHPTTPQEKRENLRFAAMEPDLFQELQERFPDMIPPEDGVVTFLNRRGFNQTAIRPAARAYLETMHFLDEAGVSESHEGENVEEKESSSSVRESDVVYGGARVGDFIDYESGGVVANPEPMRVRAISGDEQWVFVDGTETGLEMSQVIVRERPEQEQLNERPVLPLPQTDDQIQNPASGMRKAMFPLDDGDVTLIFPESISAEGLGDLADYLDIFLKKEKRKKERG